MRRHRTEKDIFKIQKLFEQAGFDFHREFMEALSMVDPRTKVEALVAIAPYFMAKMPKLELPKPPPEPTSPKDITPALEKASSEDLIKLLQSGPKTNKTNNG
jgi:hypothetical protein